MSDYEHPRYSRTYPSPPIDTGGPGVFWAIVVIAAIGLLVLIVALGSGPNTVDHPGGAGADPVVVPVAPQAAPAATGTPVE